MPTHLEPGTYRLTKTIQNPRPDRRTRHDWRLAPVWEEGMIFRVCTWKSPEASGLEPWQRFELWHGSWASYSVMPHQDEHDDNVWEILAPYLQRIDEKPSDFFKREYSGMSMSLAAAALDLMVANGVVTFDQVKEYLQRALDE